MGGMPLAEEAPAAFIFSRRQLRHRQPVGCASAAGIGMTWGSSAHQQPLACLQVIGALHWAQRVSTGKLWRDGRRASSGCNTATTLATAANVCARTRQGWSDWFAAQKRQLGCRTPECAGGFLVSRAKRVLSWIFAGGSRNARGRCISCSCNHLREIRTLDAHTGYPSIQR